MQSTRTICAMDRKHLNNFERRPTKDHSCEVWLNSINGLGDVVWRNRVKKPRTHDRTTDKMWSQKLTLSLRERWAKIKDLEQDYKPIKIFWLFIIYPQISKDRNVVCKTLCPNHILAPKWQNFQRSITEDKNFRFFKSWPSHLLIILYQPVEFQGNILNSF